MKVHPIPHAIFETTRSGFIQILHCCSVSWKITPPYFFSSNLILWTKIVHWSKILELLSGWVKIYKILHVIFETTTHFFFKLHSWEITLLYFFSWNFILFWRREPIKVPNFRPTISPNLYLDRLLLLEVCKISAKNYRGVVSHDTEDWCKIWIKTDLCFKTDKNLVNFDSSTQKSQKFTLWLVLYVKSM